VNHAALTVIEKMAVPALYAWVENALAHEQVRWVNGDWDALPEAALVDLDGTVLLIVQLDDEDFEVISEELANLT
jgi:hypothetical protein